MTTTLLINEGDFAWRWVSGRGYVPQWKYLYPTLKLITCLNEHNLHTSTLDEHPWRDKPWCVYNWLCKRFKHFDLMPPVKRTDMYELCQKLPLELCDLVVEHIGEFNMFQAWKRFKEEAMRLGVLDPSVCPICIKAERDKKFHHTRAKQRWVQKKNIPKSRQTHVRIPNW